MIRSLEHEGRLEKLPPTIALARVPGTVNC